MVSVDVIYIKFKCYEYRFLRPSSVGLYVDVIYIKFKYYEYRFLRLSSAGLYVQDKKVFFVVPANFREQCYTNSRCNAGYDVLTVMYFIFVSYNINLN